MKEPENQLESTDPADKKKRIKDAEIIRAISLVGGNITMAARKLGCDRSTIYQRRKESAGVGRVIDQCREEMIDHAESALKLAIGRGEAWAVCFCLKTVGRARGYVERTELTGKDGQDLVNVTFTINHQS